MVSETLEEAEEGTERRVKDSLSVKRLRERIKSIDFSGSIIGEVLLSINFPAYVIYVLIYVSSCI